MERIIKLDNIYNFRDLGNIRTRNNKRIKENILYRCARLDQASQNDIEFIEQLKINTIIDYRNYDEMLQHPTPILKKITIYSVPALNSGNDKLSSADLESFLKSENINKFAQITIEMYQSLPFNNSAYRLLIDKVRQCRDVILQHCTAGRDRTGVGTALLLLLLNVEQSDIIDDYLISNVGLPKFFESMLNKYQLDEETTKQVFSVIELKADYIEATFQAIIERYGSFNLYFEQEYKLSTEEIQRIRDYYTV